MSGRVPQSVDSFGGKLKTRPCPLILPRPHSTRLRLIKSQTSTLSSLYPLHRLHTLIQPLEHRDNQSFWFSSEFYIPPYIELSFSFIPSGISFQFSKTCRVKQDQCLMINSKAIARVSFKNSSMTEYFPKNDQMLTGASGNLRGCHQEHARSKVQEIGCLTRWPSRT